MLTRKSKLIYCTNTKSNEKIKKTIHVNDIQQLNATEKDGELKQKNGVQKYHFLHILFSFLSLLKINFKEELNISVSAKQTIDSAEKMILMNINEVVSGACWLL